MKEARTGRPDSSSDSCATTSTDARPGLRPAADQGRSAGQGGTADQGL